MVSRTTEQCLKEQWGFPPCPPEQWSQLRTNGVSIHALLAMVSRTSDVHCRTTTATQLSN
eukprot:4301275-Amphidinium_carterae.1